MSRGWWANNYEGAPHADRDGTGRLDSRSMSDMPTPPREDRRMTPETTPSSPNEPPTGEEATVDPRDAENARLSRYAEAIRRLDLSDDRPDVALARMAEAAMAVADAERDALRAEVERLKQEQEETYAEVIDGVNKMSDGFMARHSRVVDQKFDALARAEAAEAALAKERAIAGDLVAALLLVLHDAHPVYANTAGWRGGIGGAAITPSCALIDPPPGFDWLEADMPSSPARGWLRDHPDFDFAAAKDRLRAQWSAILANPTETGDETA